MDLLADLNEPQRRAVTFVDGPLLVLAGAGSGKTRVITRRVAHLVSQGISPSHILALTFTNKAAGEMAKRVEQLNVPPGATVCTFHSLCARMLRQFADQTGVGRNFSIYDRNDQIKLVKDVMARMDLRTGNFSPAKVHGTISHAKNALKQPDQFANEADGFYSKTVAQIYRAYDQALATNNAMDFDDLLLRMAMLLRDRPDVREALCRRYRYILIDEYQDTNRAQYIIAHGIAMDHENVCVTGDPDQSIYGWRGADIKNILEFEADYPNATVIRLEENYRSTQPILAAAGRLISNNRMRKDKSLWTRRAGGVDINVVFCDDEHAEARTIAGKIAARNSAGGRYDDVAVFYRVNSLSRVIEQAFLKAGVPYQVARGVEFYNRKEVKDVLAYLRVIVNPADDLNCQRIINTPARGIGTTTIDRLRTAAAAQGLSILAACREGEAAGLSKAAAGRAKAFAEMMDKLSQGLDRPVRQIMEDVVSETHLAEALRNGDSEDHAYANVAELISTAEEFDRSAPTDAHGLADYLFQVSLVSDVDQIKGGSGAVTLMTLHAAKGLEFPAVFIIGCEQGLLPFQRPEDTGWSTPSDSRLEEERRLAFVGMTRAQDELTLTCARSRMIRGRTTAQSASRFLTEIGTEGVTTEDLTTQAAPSSARAASPGGGGFYADSQERAIIEADQNLMPPEYEYLKVGCTVRHPKFGMGKVTQLAQRWPDTRATIDFRQWGAKKIVLSKTSIELVG